MIITNTLVFNQHMRLELMPWSPGFTFQILLHFHNRVEGTSMSSLGISFLSWEFFLTQWPVDIQGDYDSCYQYALWLLKPIDYYDLIDNGPNSELSDVRAFWIGMSLWHLELASTSEMLSSTELFTQMKSWVSPGPHQELIASVL